MIILNRYDAEILVEQAEQDFKLSVKPDLFSKLLLILTLRINKGVEFFAVGPWEGRYPFMFVYGRLINDALKRGYSVIVKKEGAFLKNEEWFLEFIKKLGKSF